MEGITYIEKFIEAPQLLQDELDRNAPWDEAMAARKTASYGVAYNYSQMAYPYREMPLMLATLTGRIRETLGFEPNNCLINYYPDGKSKMGFHADQTDILEPGTGIVIISLGATRTLRFRKMEDKATILDYALAAGSLFYMTQEIQQHWQHAIPASEVTEGRMSLTFRKIKS